MKTVYYLDRDFEVVCNCCGRVKAGIRPVWVNPSSLMFLCPDCLGFIFPLLRSLEIEIKKGGE